jgi:hypothetical protein
MIFQWYLKQISKIPRTRKNLIILFIVGLSLIILPYTFYSFFLQYPVTKNRTYFHCTETPNEWTEYKLENFEMYDVRIKENVNVYVTIVKFYEDREFLKEQNFGTSNSFPFLPNLFASFAFDTEKYIVFSIPVFGDSKPPDYFVLNRFNLTAQTITQSFLSKENKKLSFGNRNKLNDEIDELVKKRFESNSKILDHGKLALIKEESIHENNFIKNIRKASN